MTVSWRDVNAIYQIYPRSFKDANGDGVGDLAGITEKLDYLSGTLGVDAIWLSPFYPSPQADCGYDVADYCEVDPLFGTLADFDTLLEKAHEQGMNVMIDLVPNHTSDQHAWFKEARSSRDNPKRNWYVWRDTPNNWQSISGGSSWTLDETSGQYYLHSFMPSQPDLNWENPEVRQAMQEVMRFWFAKGVDGFRVDAVWALSKDPELRDDPANPAFDAGADQYGSYLHSACKNGPHLVEYLQELAAVAREYENKYLLFEFYADEALGDATTQVAQLHMVAPDVAMPFYFEAIHVPWHAERFGKTISSYLATLQPEMRPTFCFSNHDQPRLASRYSGDQARLIACMLMTLPGLPVMYYGDELGMENVDIPPELTKDKFEKTGDSGGRDPERTPMQWDDSTYAGFSTVTPWLPVPSDLEGKTVLQEQQQADSWLSLYQRLLEVRHEAVIQHGSFMVIDAGSGYVLAYERRLDHDVCYVVLNFADAAQIVALPVAVHEIVAVSHVGAVVIREDGRVSLQGFSAAILREWPGQGNL